MTARRKISAAVIAAAALCTSGCGSGVANGRLTEVVYVNPLLGDPAWDQLGHCMADEGKKFGIKVHTVGPPGDKVDMVTMENQISQAISNHAQAIVTWSSGAPAAIDALFARARAQGTEVATYLSWDATKNQTFEVGDGPPGTDKGAVFSAISAGAGQRYVGMLTQRPTDDFGDIGVDRQAAAAFPNVSVVDVRYDYGTFASDVDVVAAMLAAHPEINVIYNYNTFSGTQAAVRERHLVGKVAVITGYEPGDEKSVIQAIDEGVVTGVRVPYWCGSGRIIIDRLRDGAAGKKLESSYFDGFKVVTGEEFKKLASQGPL